MWSGFLFAAAAVASERANYVPRERPSFGNETILSLNSFEAIHAALVKDGHAYWYGDKVEGEPPNVIGMPVIPDHYDAPDSLSPSSDRWINVPTGTKVLDACVGNYFTCMILQRTRKRRGVVFWKMR